MPETPTVRQLDKILQVNDDTYEVNAVYADEAGKVHNPLVIKKQTGWADTDTETALTNPDGEYNGYKQENINIVPAEGGYFTGPIHVKNASDFDDLTDVERLTLAINRADITTLLTRLTGAPAYLWRDSQLLPIILDISVPQSDSQDDPETTKQEATESEAITTVYAKISFIFGDYKDFNAFIASTDKPDLYLYICIDDSRTTTEANNCASNIYLGGAVLFEGDPGYIRIASHAELANRALNADNAAEAAKATEAAYSHSLKDTDTDNAYSYDALHELLEDIDEAIETITGTGDGSISKQLATHNTDQNAHSYLLTCIRKILRQSSIPSTETSDHFQVYNSQRLAGKNESKFQKRIFIGTESQRNTMALAYADKTTGTPTFVEGDIWIKLES